MAANVFEVDCPFGGKTEVHIVGDKGICLRCVSSSHQFTEKQPKCEKTASADALQKAQAEE